MNICECQRVSIHAICPILCQIVHEHYSYLCSGWPAHAHPSGAGDNIQISTGRVKVASQCNYIRWRVHTISQNRVGGTYPSFLFSLSLSLSPSPSMFYDIVPAVFHPFIYMPIFLLWEYYGCNLSTIYTYIYIHILYIYISLSIYIVILGLRGEQAVHTSTHISTSI